MTDSAGFTLLTISGGLVYFFDDEQRLGDPLTVPRAYPRLPSMVVGLQSITVPTNSSMPRLHDPSSSGAVNLKGSEMAQQLRHR